ncbi:MAG: hypothetical protein QNK37_15730 [Acidobacteriota bacterium]|nr:hypothetical protein [Acidobacteriota bacterium]
MSHLTDFEELIARIPNPPTADYMREAMACYMAGAYRGCIVLSFIALFDDLLQKLGELAMVNSEAKRIYAHAQKLQEDQKVFERFLIKELGRTHLIPELDAQTLDLIRSRRNRAAHPSGHQPSAEEARFIFQTVVDQFLSQPLLRTTQLVDDIAQRLANTYFFTSESVKNNAEIVRREIRLLHREARPALLATLLDKVLDSNPTIARNARRFILGLAALDDPDLNDALRKRVISARADDAAYSRLVLSLISANGKLGGNLDEACRQRLLEVLADRTREIGPNLNPSQLDHPVRVLGSIRQSQGETELCEQFGDEVSRCLEKFPYVSYFGPVFGALPRFRDTYVGVLLDQAGSFEFDEANAFADAVPELDEQLGDILTGEEAFRLITAVVDAAQNGAFASMDLKNTRFAALPQVRARALAFTREEPARALETAGGADKLAHLTAAYLNDDKN